MEGEYLSVSSDLDHLVVEIDAVPIFECFRLSLGQICLHRELCFR